jgi:hypothetical protein
MQDRHTIRYWINLVEKVGQDDPAPEPIRLRSPEMNRRANAIHLQSPEMNRRANAIHLQSPQAKRRANAINLPAPRPVDDE